MSRSWRTTSTLRSCLEASGIVMNLFNGLAAFTRACISSFSPLLQSLKPRRRVPGGGCLRQGCCNEQRLRGHALREFLQNRIYGSSGPNCLEAGYVTHLSILDPGQVPEIKGVTRWEQTKSFVNFELTLLGSRLERLFKDSYRDLLRSTWQSSCCGC